MVVAFLGASGRLRAIVMSFKRNQIPSPGGLVRAFNFFALLLSLSVASICPAALQGAIADESATAQERVRPQSHEAEQNQQQEPSSSPTAPASFCEALAKAAASHDLPADFFARLIWQESHFKADAVSRAGAQGVAQFMLATARLRQIEDPFNQIEAIVKSARLLRDLRREFGNLGLAAAAY